MGKNMPTGVKVLAILGYIEAAFLVLAAIGFFIGGSFLGSIMPEGFNFLGSMIGAIGGIAMLIFAIITYFIAKGLWNGQNWARIVVIIFGVLGILGGLGAIFSGQFSAIVGLLINGLIVYYLGFVDEVKVAFN